jgi:hypothetical protein
MSLSIYSLLGEATQREGGLLWFGDTALNVFRAIQAEQRSQGHGAPLPRITSLTQLQTRPIEF